MARYEGMEHLLQGVRDRLGVDGAPEDVPPPRGAGKEEYAGALECLLLLLQDTQKFREAVEPYRRGVLSDEQREDLLALLGKILQELRVGRDILEDTNVAR